MATTLLNRTCGVTTMLMAAIQKTFKTGVASESDKLKITNESKNTP
jgi:hypothetical protein